MNRYKYGKGNYEILSEKVTSLNSDVKIEMVTINNPETGKFVDIPNHTGVFKVYESDIPLIDFFNDFAEFLYSNSRD